MALFQYRAFDNELAEVSGTIAADTPRHARDVLRDQGLLIEGVVPLKERTQGRVAALIAKRRSSPHVTSFVRELSTLLAVGIPLLSALDTVEKQLKGRFRDVILRLRERVSAGASLADSMRAAPEAFDDLAVHIAEVGEESGTLEDALAQLADFKERSGQLKSRVAAALTYPLIVLTMAVAITILLMTFVVPNILEPLLETGAELPAITHVVKTTSDLLIGWWWLLLIGGLAIVGGVALVLRTERGLESWHRAQLKIPIVGSLIRRQSIVRIATVVATLLRSGIVFLRAVEIARGSVKNRVMARALKECEAAVGAGRDISEALERTGAFPPTVVQVFSVGQQSGRLEEMLERLAADYDGQVQSQAQRLTSILEPAMILILATLVGFIAFATILPILEAGHVL